MISIRNISKKYKKNEKVIDNLSLEINDGEIFGFLGPNRCRKNNYNKNDDRNIRNR